MYKKVFQRLSAMLLCAMLCVPFLSQTALASSHGLPAAELLTDAEQYSITLNYPVPGDVTLTGAAFKLYRVATLTEDVQFHLQDSWKQYTESYGVVMKAETNQDWFNLASTLSSILTADVVPDAQGTLNTNNQVVFENLKQGLYLVLGEKATDTRTGTVYTPMPFFAYMPYWENEQGEWVKSATLDIKYESQPVQKVSRQVVKQWDDAGLESVRPTSVTVELRRNGESWEIRTLSAENNWREMWEDLDSRYTWDVVEIAGNQGYTVSTVTQGETVIITNSKRPTPVTPPPTPTPTPDPTPTPPTVTPSNDPSTLTGPQPDPTPSRLPEGPNTTMSPVVSGPPVDNTVSIDDWKPPLTDMPYFETTETDFPNTEDTENIPDSGVPLGKLPQTGLLWWPVPLMLMAGLSLFCAGMYLHTRGTNEEK